MSKKLEKLGYRLDKGKRCVLVIYNGKRIDSALNVRNALRMIREHINAN